MKTKAASYEVELAAAEDNTGIVACIMYEGSNLPIDPTDEHSDDLVKFDDGSVIDLSEGKETAAEAWDEAYSLALLFQEFEAEYLVENAGKLDPRSPFDRKEIAAAFWTRQIEESRRDGGWQ